MSRLVWTVMALGCLVPLQAAAQEAAQKGAGIVWYAELGGNTLFSSLNLEVMLTPELGLRAGASPVATFPIMLNYLPGAGPHRAELGAGVVLGGSGNGETIGTGTIGYRYQPHDGRLVLRAGITPLFGGAGIVPWAGLSIGLSFRPQAPPDPD